MAAPSYTEDLTDITLSESTTGFSALGGGGAGLGAGVDFAIQGTNAVDKQITNALKGMIYDNGSTITNSTDKHFFIWLFTATPGVCAAEASGGIRATLGTSTSDYMDFYVGGNDTFPQGGVKCYPIRYTTTTTSTRVATGTPGANPQWFGGQLSTTAAVKGANFAVDAIRHGTGAYITAGESANPATFDGFATQNDSNANRWGILSNVGGIYQLQGRFVIGQNNSQVATLAYFDDTGSVVTFTDTPHSATDFTQIIIDHASTEAYFNSNTFIGQGTNNPGRFVVNNASSIVELNSCNFSSIGISTLRAGVTADSTSWRSCGQITANDATIQNCTISDYSGASDTSALVWDTNTDTDVNLDGTTFIKGTGTTHALELGTNSPTSVTLNNVTFSGYGANTTTSAAIYVKRTSGTVTINVNGGTTPTYKSDGATVSIVNTASLTLTGLKNPTEVRVFNAGTTTDVAGQEDVTTGTFSASIDAATYTSVDVAIVSLGYLIQRLENIDMTSGNVSIPIQQTIDRQYNNP